MSLLKINKYRFPFFLLLLLTTSFPVHAEDFPKPGWADVADPLAATNAQPGGEVSTFGGQYPKSINYYLDNNTLSAEIFGAFFETLLTMNPVTLEYEPGLAEKWSISEDKKIFTFYEKDGGLHTFPNK